MTRVGPGRRVLVAFLVHSTKPHYPHKRQ
jgi:hypothetical protein